MANPSPGQIVANRRLLLPYFAPYLVYVALASVPEHILPATGRYLVQLILTPGLLVWAWRWYVPLGGPNRISGSIATGVIAGLIGCALWVALMLPFVDTAGKSWQPAAYGLRMAAATLVVPVFEELLMRGYVLRLALQWDRARRAKVRFPLQHALDERCVNEVAPGDCSLWALLISTAAFAAGHHMVEWPAAVFYGFLMASLWMLRKDLISCIVAHGTTNLALAFYVRYTGQWGLW